MNPSATSSVVRSDYRARLGFALGLLGVLARVANDAQGWDELIAKLKGVNVDLVALEANAGFERGLMCALQDAGITVARVNPRQARDFDKPMGVLAARIGQT